MDITDLLRCSTLFPYTCGRSDGSGHPDRQGLLVTQRGGDKCAKFLILI